MTGLIPSPGCPGEENDVPTLLAYDASLDIFVTGCPHHTALQPLGTVNRHGVASAAVLSIWIDRRQNGFFRFVETTRDPALASLDNAPIGCTLVP